MSAKSSSTPFDKGDEIPQNIRKAEVDSRLRGNDDKGIKAKIENKNPLNLLPISYEILRLYERERLDVERVEMRRALSAGCSPMERTIGDNTF